MFRSSYQQYLVFSEAGVIQLGPPKKSGQNLVRKRSGWKYVSMMMRRSLFKSLKVSLYHSSITLMKFQNSSKIHKKIVLFFYLFSNYSLFNFFLSNMRRKGSRLERCWICRTCDVDILGQI